MFQDYMLAIANYRQPQRKASMCDLSLGDRGESGVQQTARNQQSLKSVSRRKF
ncbi:hypothetical protein [Thermoleptolyngbya sp. C42_A2020_037]|uniref:hypothetical protein n=1 Tax=Thermoleptolyngbya sp. C42_A2020_037 TaxID=2747799 RepID=UPI001A0A56FC|nr:hypothetical protein [Thermoleptolyngbya sp. C42_A2020_037]MBF2087186.1 hypothetical protein [Thermoleptolyngbya sp. C42_A2020_037]